MSDKAKRLNESQRLEVISLSWVRQILQANEASHGSTKLVRLLLEKFGRSEKLFINVLIWCLKRWKRKSLERLSGGLKRWKISYTAPLKQVIFKAKRKREHNMHHLTIPDVFKPWTLAPYCCLFNFSHDKLCCHVWLTANTNKLV